MTREERNKTLSIRCCCPFDISIESTMKSQSWKSAFCWSLMIVSGTWGQTTSPNRSPTFSPNRAPSFSPNRSPTFSPNIAPTLSPQAFNGTVSPAPSSGGGNATEVSTESPTEEFNITTFPTTSPTFNLSDSPTLSPSVNITLSPSKSPSKEPSQLPSNSPSSVPTAAPTGVLQQATMDGLAIDLFGITEFPTQVYETWRNTTAVYQKQYYATIADSPVSDFQTTITINSLILPARMRNLRMLQEEDFVTVLYSQTMDYRFVGDKVDPELIATLPFMSPTGRESYVRMLQQTGQGVLTDITSASQVTVDASATPTIAPANPPTAVPVPSPVEEEEKSGIASLSIGAIIGIAVGGGVCLIGLLLFFFFSTGDNDYEGANEPPPSVNVKREGDEISTLAPPQFGGPPVSHESIAGYGDQSVATVDYDYSKAYGGGGDTSVSSAGGTFGSQTRQSFLDPRTASATGATLGAYSDADSFEETYRDPNANVKEEMLHVFAPPGKLGVVIDTPDDGAPVVHAVKDSSVIADRIQVGDKLVAVDDEDVRTMTAIKVSKLISRKSANPSRKLTIVRTTVIE